MVGPISSQGQLARLREAAAAMRASAFEGGSRFWRVPCQRETQNSQRELDVKGILVHPSGLKSLSAF